MEIVAGTGNFLPPGSEGTGEIRLVRILILGKPYVPIDTKQRLLHFQAFQCCIGLLYIAQQHLHKSCKVLTGLIISFSISIEPFLLIVLLQVFQKPECSRFYFHFIGVV